jgi:hypothetical protein
LDGQIDTTLIDALANIAIIGPTINIRISKQNPMDYIPKYKITAEKLRQQFISGQIMNTAVKQYPEWVRGRAVELASEGNAFLEELRGDLKLPDIVADSQRDDHAYDAA